MPRATSYFECNSHKSCLETAVTLDRLLATAILYQHYLYPPTFSRFLNRRCSDRLASSQVSDIYHPGTTPIASMSSTQQGPHNLDKTADLSNRGPKGAIIITPHDPMMLIDKTCPICKEEYAHPLDAVRKSEHGHECPVSVDLVAEWWGHRKCCGHIFGRKCLVKHLASGAQWSNKCPMCRDIWLHRYPPEEVEESLQQRVQPEPAPAPAVRRSRRIAARAAVQPYPSSRRLSNRAGITHASQPRRPLPPPAYFEQRLLAALRVAEGSREINGTMADVEERLSTLYESL